MISPFNDGLNALHHFNIAFVKLGFSHCPGVVKMQVLDGKFSPISRLPEAVKIELLCVLISRNIAATRVVWPNTKCCGECARDTNRTDNHINDDGDKAKIDHAARPRVPAQKEEYHGNSVGSQHTPRQPEVPSIFFDLKFVAQDMPVHLLSLRLVS